ncbi:hypothetical protein SDC9_76593 [bioreactor metagenome]|uniref:Uncharacterized protein n=1 Tax=bioreactor metagenome TaxID=1076179 RepID=A0A644YQA9_9ZZZZ
MTSTPTTVASSTRRIAALVPAGRARSAAASEVASSAPGADAGREPSRSRGVPRSGPAPVLVCPWSATPSSVADQVRKSRGETREGAAARVLGGLVQLLLDAQQLVVLGDTVGTGRSAGLDLATAAGDREVGDGDVLGLTGTVRHHRPETVAVREVDGVQGLGQRTDLVHLDQQGVGGLLVDAALQALDVGDEQVVADQLDLVTDLGGDLLPAFPVLLVQRVLDGDDREAVDPLLVDGDHLVGGLLGALEDVLAVLVELGGGDVERHRDVLARLQAGGDDGLGDQLQGGDVGRQVRGEAALVTQAGGQALGLEDLLEGVVDARAPLEGLPEGGGADRGDHELLDVHVGVGVGATVEDVHHRHGKDVGRRTADVAVERQVGRLCGGVGDGQRDAEDGVGAQLALVRGAVEFEHGLVEEALLGGLEAQQLGGDLLDDVLDGLQDALAAVARIVAVTQLDGLELPGRSAGRDVGAALGVVVEDDLDLDSRVAARVENLAGVDEFDACHGGCLSISL